MVGVGSNLKNSRKLSVIQEVLISGVMIIYFASVFVAKRRSVKEEWLVPFPHEDIAANQEMTRRRGLSGPARTERQCALCHPVAEQLHFYFKTAPK